MKKHIVLSLLTAAVMLLAGGLSVPAHAHSPGTDLKPTFISPTPKWRTGSSTPGREIGTIDPQRIPMEMKANIQAMWYYDSK